MNYVYPAVFHPEGDGYVVRFPDINGCCTQGINLENAKYMAKDVLQGFLETLLDYGLNIPSPSNPDNLKLELNDFVMLVEANLISKLIAGNVRP